MELSNAAIMWLASGRRGISSNTIFTHLTGIDAMEGWSKSHPYDPADFDRCLNLLDKVPEFRELLPKMRTCSPVWDALIDRWDEIEKSHLDEVGLGWTKGEAAPKTYDLIQSIIRPNK